MKVLVIPDVHLKPWMFERAEEIMKKGMAERAVCLMDIPDDWNQEYNLKLYRDTFDAAIAFAKKYPNTLWCYGNHDLSYLWNKRESGYSRRLHIRWRRSWMNWRARCRRGMRSATSRRSIRSSSATEGSWIIL